MAEINKINLKALKENYMKKPDEEKSIEEDAINNDGKKSENGTATEKLIVQEGDRKEENKEHKLGDKELFSKYESFFKKEGEQIQKKLHNKKNKTGGSKTKKYVINFFAGVALLQLIIIPGYFIYSGGNLDSIKASLFDSKENNNTEDIKPVHEDKVDPIPEEIIREKEKFNVGGYIFDIETETNSSGEKKFIYKGKEYISKDELKKGLEKEIKRLKRLKLIKLLLEEKELEKQNLE